MVMTRGSFSNAIAPGYRKVVFETYKERPLEGQALVNLNTSRRAYEDDFNVGGFGTLQIKPEGGEFQYQDAIQGFAKRYIWTTFALGFRITQEMMEDDLYGIVGGKMSKALGRAARNNEEIVMHAPYNNAFNTSFTGFNPGESLCSASHALLRGGTYNNRPAQDADFGLLSFQAAIESFQGLVDESAMPIIFIPKLVVHNPGDMWIVNQVLKSEKLPGSNQNDVNEAAQLGVMPHMSHYLTDNDAWYVVADQHDINYFNRRQLKFTNSDDFKTGDALFKADRRNGSGYGDWRGIYGSQGA